MRLKTITLFILFLFSFGFINAQCEIGNGSFEDWITTDFILSDGDDGAVTAEVMVPESTVPFLRLFLLGFAAASDPSFGMLLESEAQELLGISQSTDASEGEFAVKLQAGYSVELADIYGVFGCSELPEEVSIDVKHVGVADDSLIVAVVFDKGLGALPQSEEDLADLTAYAYAEIGFDSTTNYQTITLPVVQNMEAPIDTFYYVIIGETSDSTHFLIDNIRFDDDNTGCELTAPTLSLANDAGVTCICNLFDTSFPLEYTVDPDELSNQIIVDGQGTIISIDEFDPGVHYELCSPTNDLSAYIVVYDLDIIGLEVGNNINDLDGCFALSNEVLLQTTSLPAFDDFDLYIDGVQQGEEFSICLMDDIVEEFSFSGDIGADNVAILIIDDDNTGQGSIIAIRLDDINATTNLMELEPGDYIIGAIRYEGSFNLEVGQDLSEFTYDGCFSASEDAYYIEVLGPEDNCVLDIEELYTGNLSIRPNFSNGLFEVYNPNNESFQLTIRDVSGRTIQNGNSGQKSGVIDLVGHPNGIYIATFSIDGLIYQQKLVKI